MEQNAISKYDLSKVAVLIVTLTGEAAEARKAKPGPAKELLLSALMMARMPVLKHNDFYFLPGQESPIAIAIRLDGDHDALWLDVMAMLDTLDGDGTQLDNYFLDHTDTYAMLTGEPHQCRVEEPVTKKGHDFGEIDMRLMAPMPKLKM
jgi:hypothetical protein